MNAPQFTELIPLAFNDVQLRAGDVPILRGLTVTLSPGAPTVLIGPNGSGKTTLLRVAMGLVAPSGGCITWGGDREAAPPRRAIVFQRPVMLRRSVSGNLLFALRAAGLAKNERERRAAELLRLVGLESFSSRPARRLSGGEQQRLALARALARDPAVLFLDEPTASLDPAATKSIEDIIRTLASRGIKIVMSTHDLGEARRLAGEVVLLHQGSVVESGPAETFFAGPSTDYGRRFIAGELGDGVKRYPVMYNDFVLIGPASDPAGVSGMKDIGKALRRIKDAAAPFVSRGDRSGTHLAELALWKDAGIDIEHDKGPWYKSIGQGMGAALNFAAASNAYVLADRGTWIHFQNKADLRIVVQGDRRLFNQYGVILVNPRKHPNVRAALGQQFIDFLVSPAGQDAIARYRIDGQQLFYPDARDPGA